MVVLDRNGNGLIDSGRELFGDATVLTRGPRAGQNAANGYEALADLDINADGAINSLDAAYSNLRIWQDANQDGISQASELRTLGEAGIASMNVASQASNINLGNGNTQPFSGTFTRTNGSSGASGVAEVSGSLLLASNNFYREFIDNPVLTTAAAALPQMRGSGWVRDLREAISLGTPAAQGLQTQVTQFAAGTTRAAQMAAVDGLIQSWGATTGRQISSTFEYSLVLQSNGTLSTANYQYGGAGSYELKLHPVGLEELVATPNVVGAPSLRPTAAGYELLRRLNVLESFNGGKFISMMPPTTTGTGDGLAGSGSQGGGVAGARQFSASLSAAQIAFINQAYDALQESVYSALVLQTRLKPYLDQIGLVIDDAGVRFDTAALSALLASTKLVDGKTALVDLIELNRYSNTTLQAVGYDGLSVLKSWINAIPAGSMLLATLTDMNVYSGASTAGSAGADIWLGDANGNSFSGGAGNDLISGYAGNDNLSGGAGDDNLDGGDGTDTLNGGAGNDTLEGGAGNDYLNGNEGADVYVFNRGGGQDTINNYDADAPGTNADTARFGAGISVDQLWLARSGSNLEVSIIGTTDKFTFAGWYSASQYRAEQFKTSDGKTLLDSQVQNLVDAMAAFAPPAAGQTTLTAAYATSLAPVFAANWQ